MIIINLTNEVNYLTQKRSTTLDDVRSLKFLDKNIHEN